VYENECEAPKSASDRPRPPNCLLRTGVRVPPDHYFFVILYASLAFFSFASKSGLILSDRRTGCPLESVMQQSIRCRTDIPIGCYSPDAFSPRLARFTLVLVYNGTRYLLRAVPLFARADQVRRGSSVTLSVSTCPTSPAPCLVLEYNPCILPLAIRVDHPRAYGAYEIHRLVVAPS